MNINVLKFGGTTMSDHHTMKKVLEVIRKYENPVVVISATADTKNRLLKAANFASVGDSESAQIISSEIETKYLQLIEDFLKENPHGKNKLIHDSCIKKLKEKIGKLNKFLAYVRKKGDLNPQMKDAITALGEQITAYVLAQLGLAVNLLTQHIEARKLIKTDTEYGKANPNVFLITQKCDSLETVLESGFTPVIGGNHGEAPDRTLTSLGSKDSALTANLIAKALNAASVEVFDEI